MLEEEEEEEEEEEKVVLFLSSLALAAVMLDKAPPLLELVGAGPMMNFLLTLVNLILRD
jgi:hypothetical protein